MATQARPGSSVLKRAFVGRAMASSHLEHTLLPKILALPVFSSDPMSSVAYATEEIMIVLLAASSNGKGYVFPISIAIAALLAIVVISYRQTVRAYPNGGGAYIVSKENIGTGAGLVAAAALLVDYVMTVVVSVVAGVYAITSAAPNLVGYRVWLSVAFVLFITLANLRGVRESGTLFAIPTYGFIAIVLLMIGLGIVKCLGGCPAGDEIASAPEVASTVQAISLFVILHAFSSGSTALTGVEAISNGVPAFRRPQSKNAAETLAVMGVIAITMFLGISWLATHIENVTVSDERTVIAQIGHTVFGGGFGFYTLSFFTASILILAANTAYQDFPRLSAILARDRFMPRQFMNRGDRLVFSNGVIGLAFFASVIIVAFNANLTQLIQLYVVGVFTSFTLSQTGMVRHWLKEKHKGVERAAWVATLHRHQHDRCDHDGHRAHRDHVHQVRPRGVALDTGDGRARADLLHDPPALRRGDRAAQARQGPCGSHRRQSHGAGDPRSRRRGRRGGRCRPLDPTHRAPRRPPVRG